jgi:hypothetical protein
MKQQRVESFEVKLVAVGSIQMRVSGTRLLYERSQEAGENVRRSIL